MTLPNIPKRLKDAFLQDKLALFVGSGLSLGADIAGGFPTWSELPIRLLDLCEHEYESAEPAKIAAWRALFGTPLSLQEMLSTLDTVKLTLKNDYSAALSRIFRPPDAACGAAHRALMELEVKAVLITNYDELLEKAERPPDRQPYTWRQAAQALLDLREGRKVLLKVHGTASDHQSVVLTWNEYQSAHADASYQAVLGYLMQDHTFLFVGYGMNDPLDLDLALKGNAGAFKHASRQHFVLLRNPSQSDRERLSDQFNVHVISYDDHADVEGFLRALKTLRP